MSQNAQRDLSPLSVAREEPNQLQHSHIGSHDLVNNQANFVSCERASHWTTEQRVDKMLQRVHSSVVDAFLESGPARATPQGVRFGV